MQSMDLDRAPFAFVKLDPSLRVTAWSGGAARMFGVSAAEALGGDVGALIAVREPGFWAGLRVGSEGPRVATWVAADGTSRVIEWESQVERAAGGAVVATACYGRDVTARTSQEAQSKLEGAMLRAILTNINLIVWMMEKDGLCTYHQGKGLAAIRMGPGALVGQNIRELYKDGDMSLLDAVFAGELVASETEVHGQCFDNWWIPMRGESGAVERMLALSLVVTEQRHGDRALRDKLEQIESQQRTIRELSTPIVEVWDRVLTLPIIGMVDGGRAAEIMDNLLQAVTRTRARFAILDLTGVKEIDMATAGYMLGLVRAIRLLGAEGVITGIHPNIAQTIVNLGLELSNLTVRATLREALAHCISQLHVRAR